MRSIVSSKTLALVCGLSIAALTGCVRGESELEMSGTPTLSAHRANLPAPPAAS